MADKVDVLAVFERHIADLRFDFVGHLSGESDEPFRAAQQKLVDMAVQARDAVSDLVAGAQKFKREFDSAQADNEGEWLIQPSAGCYECTLHTVPHDRDRGLCGYHKLERALTRIGGAP